MNGNPTCHRLRTRVLSWADTNVSDLRIGVSLDPIKRCMRSGNSMDLRRGRLPNQPAEEPGALVVCPLLVKVRVQGATSGSSFGGAVGGVGRWFRW